MRKKDARGHLRRGHRFAKGGKKLRRDFFLDIAMMKVIAEAVTRYEV